MNNSSSKIQQPPSRSRLIVALATLGLLVCAVPSAQAGVCAPSFTSYNPGGTPTAYEMRGVVWTGAQFVVVGSGGVIKKSTLGAGTWAEISPAPTANQINAIAWSGKQLVGVGENGTIVTSDKDASTWNASSFGSEAYYGITWSGSQFVAVGTNGAIMTSSDAITWEARTSNVSVILQSVTWSGETFVAVGADGTILTSANGANWIQRTSGLTTALEGVAWSGSQFLAVGVSRVGACIVEEEPADCNSLLTSPNGINWTIRNVTNPTKNLHGVTWNGRQFNVAGDGGTVLTSTDGITWSFGIISSGGERLQGITWNGRYFLAAGNTNRTARSICTWGDTLTLAATRWTQVGIPALNSTAATNTVNYIFAGGSTGSGVGGTYDPTYSGTAGTWTMSKRDASAQVYDYLASTGVVLNQTDGYWIKSWGTGYDVTLPSSAASATPLVTTNNANCPSTVGCYEIPLVAPPSGQADRSNLVSFPLPYPVGWWDVRVQVGPDAGGSV